MRAILLARELLLLQEGLIPQRNTKPHAPQELGMMKQDFKPSPEETREQFLLLTRPVIAEQQN